MISINIPGTVTKLTLTELEILHAGRQKLVRCDTERSRIHSSFRKCSWRRWDSVFVATATSRGIQRASPHSSRATSSVYTQPCGRFLSTKVSEFSYGEWVPLFKKCLDATPPHHGRSTCPREYHASTWCSHILQSAKFSRDPTSTCLRPSYVILLSSTLCSHDTPPLADAYRGLFTFGVFNAIQSTCFDNVSLSIMVATRLFLTLHQVDAHCAKLGRTKVLQSVPPLLTSSIRLYPVGWFIPTVKHFLIYIYSSHWKRENSAI